MDRYIRNIKCYGFSLEKQQMLINSKVLVVGAGGLGSPLLSYLVAAGVGKIAIFEYDTVSVSNLQRQILYCEGDLGKHKAVLAKDRLMKINSSLDCQIYIEKFSYESSCEMAKEYDVIVDCSDNFEARYAIDRVSKECSIPFVYGSVEDMQGQVATFNFDGSLSYSDLFPERRENRPIVGVLSPLPGIIGSIQAMEVINILTGSQSNLSGKLLTFDGKTYTTNIFEIG